MGRNVRVVFAMEFSARGVERDAERDASAANPEAGKSGIGLPEGVSRFRRWGFEFIREEDLSSTANKYRRPKRKDPRGGCRPAVDRWIQEKA